MPTYVRGENVANATRYDLLKKNTDGTYKILVNDASAINFEVSALGLETGSHELVVQAHADGYESSDYSNEVTYTVSGNGGNTEPDVPGGDTDENAYNSADMWLSQTISSGGAVSTTGITQSNIMAKSRFVGSATFESLGESLQMALVTYNDDGSFKARGSWISLTKDSPVTYTDENPFNVVIATKTTNTSYSVAEMVAMLNIVGTSEDSFWDGTIYSDSTSYWIRQSMDGSGNVVAENNAGYNRSNLMAASNFNESIKITAKSVRLMTAIITYDTSGKFISRSTWSTVEIGQSVTYTDANPFNVIIATSAESSYTLTEMLALIDVRSAV